MRTKKDMVVKHVLLSPEVISKLEKLRKRIEGTTSQAIRMAITRGLDALRVA